MKNITYSPNPVDILSFDKDFLECDIAQGLIFRTKRSKKSIILQWTLILITNT